MQRFLPLCFLLSAACALAQEQTPPQKPPQSEQAAPNAAQLAAKAEQAYQNKDFQAYLDYLQEIRAQQPYNGQVLYKLAGAYALNEKPEQAFTTLVMLQKQGLALSPKGDEDFANIDQYQLFDFLSKHLEENDKPFNKAPLAFTLDQQGLLPEGIAYDAEGQAFYIGSVRRGGVWRVNDSGEAELFIEPGTEGLNAVFGLAVDEERDALWVTSNVVPQFKDYESDAKSQSALFRFGLEDGAFQGRYPVSNDKLDHVLGNVVVAPDGVVYVSDSLSPLIFRWSPQDEKLTPFIGSPRMTSLQGLALSPDGEYLFVTDYTKGVFRIQLDNRQVVRIGHEPEFNLGGIHDLVFYENSLIAVQNGTNPPRVVRYTLSDNMGAVIEQQPLSANQPEYDELGQGVRVGDKLYFIANTQWALYGKGGEVKNESALEAVKVLKADLELGEKLRKQSGMKSVVPESE